MVFGRNFCKNVKFGYLNPILGKLGGDARPWLMARWKAHGRFSIRINWTFFRYLLRFWSYEAKCVQLGWFHRGSTSFHSNFAWTQSSPINHFWCQKTRDTGLPDSEDRIPLRSFVLTQCRSVSDGRTDRRTDGYAVAHTALAKLALWRAVKMDPRKKNIDAAF